MPIKNSAIDISIVIPSKDEEQCLVKFLNEVVLHCRKSSQIYEIIVIDDGSTDRTYQIAMDFLEEFPHSKVIKFNKNRGKGHAVKCGMLEARGEIVLFLDADGAVSPSAIDENLHYLNEGYDIVIGSRVVRDGRHVVKGKFHRKFMGTVFNFLVRYFLFKEICDTQCGFKMFRREIVNPLFSRLHIRGFGFDIEILFLAYKMGCRIKEVAVNWKDRKSSKVNLIFDSCRMFMNILQVRYWHFTPINMKDKYISVEQLKFMYKLEGYHWWFYSKRELLGYLLKNLDMKFESILDAGCGTGQNLLFLKKFCPCYGCDIVKQALEFCRSNGLKNLVRCDVGNMSFRDEKFDIITSLDVLEHIEDPEKVLVEFKRILKRNGKAIITVPAFKFLWSQHDEALSHLRRYEKQDLIELVTEAGFGIEKIGYFYFTSFFAVTPWRIIRRLFVKKGRCKNDATTLPPKFFNEIIKWIFKVEVKILSVFPLPLGTTLYAVISKKC